MSVASHIARANTDVDEKTASAIALEAGQPGARFRFPRDIADPNRTLVQVGNNQPVVMGSDALAMIAMIRGGVLRGATTGTPTPYNPTPDPATQRLTTGPVAEPQRPGTSPTPKEGAVPAGGISTMNQFNDDKALLRQANENIARGRTEGKPGLIAAGRAEIERQKKNTKDARYPGVRRALETLGRMPPP